MTIFYDAYHAARRKSRIVKVTAGAVTAVLVGAVVLVTPPGGGGGGGSLANLWVDTTAGVGTCTRAATAATYTDAASCSSFQSAAAAASAGDTVRVKAGSYGGQTVTAVKSSPGVSFIAENGTSVGTLSPTGAWLSFQNMSVSNIYFEDVGSGRPNNITFDAVNANAKSFWDGGQNITWKNSTIGPANTPVDGIVTMRGLPGTGTCTNGSTCLQNVTFDNLTFTGITGTAGQHTEVLRLDAGLKNFTLKNSTFVNGGSSISSAVIFLGASAGNKSAEGTVIENTNVGSSTQPGLDIANGAPDCTGGLTVRYSTFISTLNLAGCTSGTVNLTGNLGHMGNCPGGSVTQTNDHNVWDNNTCTKSGDLFNQSLSFIGDGFHINTSSPAVAHGSATYCPATDRDLQARPQPAATTCDAGSDEVSQ